MENHARKQEEFSSSNSESQELNLKQIYIDQESEEMSPNSESQQSSSHSIKKELTKKENTINQGSNISSSPEGGKKKIIIKTRKRRGRNKRGRRSNQQRDDQGKDKTEDFKKLQIDRIPDFMGEDNPDCHFKIERREKKVICKFCNEQFPEDSVASAKMNNHMLCCHRNDFKNRDFFSSQDQLQKQKADVKFFHPKFYKVDSKRSLVWQFFVFNKDISFVICTMCWMTYNVKDKSTSGMLKHMEKYHESIWNERKNSQAGEEKQVKRGRRRRVKKQEQELRSCEIKSEKEVEVMVSDEEKMSDDDEIYRNDILGRVQFSFHNDCYSKMGYI